MTGYSRKNMQFDAFDERGAWRGRNRLFDETLNMNNTRNVSSHFCEAHIFYVVCVNNRKLESKYEIVFLSTRATVKLAAVVFSVVGSLVWWCWRANGES